MRKKSFFGLDFLDYVIFTGFTWFQSKSAQLSEGSPEIIAMYDYMGRWFSKKEILDRINVLREKEKPIDQLLSDQNRKKSMILALESISRRIVGLGYDVNREILIEINNLSHRNKPLCDKTLDIRTLLKYITPIKISELAQDKGNMYCQFLPLFYTDLTKPLPHMMIFWWKQDGKLNAVCYRSMTDVVNFFEVFGISPFDFTDIFEGVILEHKNVLGYSGDDYALVFRLEGDIVTCGRPPLINHEYELPLIPHDISAVIKISAEPEYHELIEKYYTLYRLGNKKAKQAIKDSEFNLNPSDD